MTIQERIQEQLDSGNYTAGVFVDLKGLWHGESQHPTWNYGSLKLFYHLKLFYYGTRGVAKDSFCSYLDNRRQYFMLNVSNLSNQFQLMCHKGLF